MVPEVFEPLKFFLSHTRIIMHFDSGIQMVVDTFRVRVNAIHVILGVYCTVNLYFLLILSTGLLTLYSQDHKTRKV